MFRVIGFVVLALNLLFWRGIRQRLLELFPTLTWLRGLAGAAVFAVLFHPALIMVIGGWSGMRGLRAVLPDSVLMAGMAVQIAALFSLAAYGLAWVARMVLRGAVLVRARLSARSPDAVSAPVEPTTRVTAEPEPDTQLTPPVNVERRRIVAAAALAVPALALVATGGGVLASRQLPSLVKVKLPVRREMTALHGITIAQVSDVHVGSYMDASRLDEISQAMNALGADYHVITGDLLDNHVSQLELATRFVRSLTPKRGEVFMCMGNHEYIAARSADVQTIVRGLEDARAQVLLDEARELRIGGERIWMGAIDYPPSARLPGRGGRSTPESLKRALGQMRDDGAPRIVLSHHPRTYVQARDLQFDLMLSGHTHGGQIKLGRIGEHSLTPILPVEFYHQGLYLHGKSRLYVNAGAGGWLPVRINCPPELTLIELVAAA